MIVLSLFDGMSCGREALERAEIAVDRYYASEIDKYAMIVAQANYPDNIQIGDVRIFRQMCEAGLFGQVDMLIGGSPCQNLSFAGKQDGFSVEITDLEHYKRLVSEGFEFKGQSYLFWEYVWIREILKPTWWLLENVKMNKKYLKIFDEIMGVEGVFINSALVSAQNRQRYYWCNWPVSQPEDRGVTWGDVRERGVDQESYYYTKKAMQWLARHSRRKNKQLKIHSDEEKMQMLEASHYKKYSSQRFFGIVDIPDSNQAVAAMRGRHIDPQTLIRCDHKNSLGTKQQIEFRYDGKTNCLTTVLKDNVVVPFTAPYRIPAELFFFRYITPIECERLQGLPDQYTNHVSNTQRYKMLGNGWQVDTVVHILRDLKQWGAL